jgi:hypothetical protein
MMIQGLRTSLWQYSTDPRCSRIEILRLMGIIGGERGGGSAKVYFLCAVVRCGIVGGGSATRDMRRRLGWPETFREQESCVCYVAVVVRSW